MPLSAKARPEAAAVIWNWKERERMSGNSISPARARKRGAIQAAISASFGVVVFLYWSQTLAYVVFGMSSLVLLSSLISPTGIHAALERLFEASGQVVGRLLTWLLMVPLFYLFFLPFGLLFRHGRRDRLKRFYETDSSTYWEPLEVAGRSASSAERQF